MKRKQFVTFYIDRHFLGVDILLIREINRALDITEVPHSPDHVLGLINLRGQTVTVFDLGVRLGMEPRVITKQSHNIIFKIDSVGLLVDRIGDVVTVPADAIQPPPANTGEIGVEFIEGVIELATEVLMVLNAGRILSFHEAVHPESGENGKEASAQSLFCAPDMITY